MGVPNPFLIDFVFVFFFLKKIINRIRVCVLDKRKHKPNSMMVGWRTPYGVRHPWRGPPRQGCATPYGVRRHGVRYPALLRRFLLTSPTSVNRRTAPPLFQNSRFPRSGIQYRFCSFRLKYFFSFLSFLGGERGAPPLPGCGTPWRAAPLAGCATPGGVRHPSRGAPPLTGCASPHGVRAPLSDSYSAR